jgi:hypothetical protein
MGGKDSINDAPKDDEGMNGFRPPNPVTLEVTGADPCVTEDGGKVDVLLGCDKDDEKRESEKVEPIAPVRWDPMNPELFEDDFSLGVDLTPFGLKAKDDATLDISVAPGFSVLLSKENLLKASVCCCCDCC